MQPSVCWLRCDGAWTRWLNCSPAPLIPLANIPPPRCGRMALTVPSAWSACGYIVAHQHHHCYYYHHFFSPPLLTNNPIVCVCVCGFPLQTLGLLGGDELWSAINEQSNTEREIWVTIIQLDVGGEDEDHDGFDENGIIRISTLGWVKVRAWLYLLAPHTHKTTAAAICHTDRDAFVWLFFFYSCWTDQTIQLSIILSFVAMVWPAISAGLSVVHEYF